MILEGAKIWKMGIFSMVFMVPWDCYVFLKRSSSSERVSVSIISATAGIFTFLPKLPLILSFCERNE